MDIVHVVGLLRCGKSCRLRWTNYLRPDLKRGQVSDAEEKLIIDLHMSLIIGVIGLVSQSTSNQHNLMAYPLTNNHVYFNK